MKLFGFAIPAALGFICLFSNPRDAHAVPIFVPNFSFEDNVAPDNTSDQPISSWTTTGNAFTSNPMGTTFFNADGQGVPTGGNGPQSVLAIFGTSLTSAVPVTNFQANTRYSLTVAIGDRNSALEPGPLRIGFLTGDNSYVNLDAVAAATYSPEGTFREL